MFHDTSVAMHNLKPKVKMVVYSMSPIKHMNAISSMGIQLNQHQCGVNKMLEKIHNYSTL